MLLVILKEKKLLERFSKKNCKKQIKQFRVEKVMKKKGYKLYAKWKGYDSSFNSWIDKKDTIYKSEYFPEPKSLGKVKVELDLSYYATKTDLKMQQELMHHLLLKG